MINNAIYLEADTTNGVRQFDWAERTDDMVFMDPEIFIEELPRLNDGEVIRAMFIHPDDAILLQIHEEYGIH